jgi:hypothetical protein
MGLGSSDVCNRGSIPRFGVRPCISSVLIWFLVFQRTTIQPVHVLSDEINILDMHAVHCIRA